MNRSSWLALVILMSACGDGDSTFSPSSQSLSFFVTSTTSVTGNPGG